VPDPLLTALHPGAPASGAAVASQLARSLGPAEASAQPPSWLLPAQAPSFRRVLSALERYGGALLADPVGSGKTFIALAVAAEVNRGPTACLVPAALLTQWQAVASSLGVPLALCSHERVSRGCLPRCSRGLVIVDESHHFRNPRTRRYRHLAPWLVGRSVLLLTATPIVNRTVDLAHQLLLGVRDDALMPEGVSSILALLRRGCSTPALGQLVFENHAIIDSRPRRLWSGNKPDARECSAAGQMLARVDRLQLSKSEAIATLIRGVLLRGASSSPAAFGESLRRYRKLLLHAQDALRAGRSIDRRELKRFTRELDDQLVWWELLPIGKAHSEIDLGDLDQLGALIQEAENAMVGPDPKVERVRTLLADATPTLIFAASRATVRYLRDRLADQRIAWCTGDRAGIGRAMLSRRSVLSWFLGPVSSEQAPTHLVVTDVAAEGLDLKRVARVIHYDLPWTPMRLEQREGRAVRHGSSHTDIEVVTFALPPALERRLQLTATLVRKRRLPAALGLGAWGKHIWQWRAELANRFEGAPAAYGVAWVPAPPAGLLAGYGFHRVGQPGAVSAAVLWIDADGKWTESTEILMSRLESAATHHEILPVDYAQLQEYLTVLTKPVRDRLNSAQGRRWIAPEPSPGISKVVRRLHALVRQAVRRHDARALRQLERATAFVAAGHTAGETALLDRLAVASQSEFKALIGTLPSRETVADQLEVRLTGLVIFGPPKTGSGAVACPAWPDSRPPCSTSTVP
jgi:superfamily II DNA or RNA helicase